jgi:hypothetical protein
MFVQEGRILNEKQRTVGDHLYFIGINMGRIRYFGKNKK